MKTYHQNNLTETLTSFVQRNFPQEFKRWKTKKEALAAQDKKWKNPDPKPIGTAAEIKKAKAKKKPAVFKASGASKPKALVKKKPLTIWEKVQRQRLARKKGIPANKVEVKGDPK